MNNFSPIFVLKIAIISLLLTSCASWVKIANLTIVSTRNYESKTEYKELQRFAEGYDDGKSIRSSGGSTYIQNNGRLTAAIEDAIRNVPGGELMKNVTVSTKHGKIKVVGDVWGLPENANKNQFGHNINIGDKVRFKLHGNYIKGQVISTDAEQAAISYSDDRGQEQTKKMYYDDLIKDSTPSQQTSTTKDEFSIGDMVTWKKLWNDDYEKGTIIGFKGSYAQVQYKDEKTDKEKTKEILKSNLTKIQVPATTTSEKKGSSEVEQKPLNKPVSKPTTTKDIYKTTSEINMRAGAGVNYSKIMTISKNESVEVVNKSNSEWWQIIYHDEIGFVSSKLLSK